MSASQTNQDKQTFETDGITNHILCGSGESISQLPNSDRINFNTGASNKQTNANATNGLMVTDGANYESLERNISSKAASGPSQSPPQLPALMTNAANAKPNGLKNRIIQRPPPLVLDKVSNFYDADTNNVAAQTQHQQQSLATNGISNNSSNNATTVLAGSIKQTYTQQTNAAQKAQLDSGLVRQSNITSQTDATFIDDRVSVIRNNASNNANQRFWASLNENASRNKALAQARGVLASSTNVSAFYGTNHRPSEAAVDAKVPADSLEPDLIIKHRNSSGAISSSRMVTTSTTQKPHQNHHNHHHHQTNYNHQQQTRDTLQGSVDDDNAIGLERQMKNHENFHDSNIDGRKSLLDVSDDLDDCGVSNGGNLVGVETTTPPVSESSIARAFPPLEEPPASATGSRPRSTNPFLNENDDDFEEYRNSIRNISTNQKDPRSSNEQNNFHKRPASFIAATDRLSGFPRSSNDLAANQKIVEEKFNEIHLSERHVKDQLDQTNHSPASSNSLKNSRLDDQTDSGDNPQSVHALLGALHQPPLNHLVNHPNDNLNHEQSHVTIGQGHTISIDSESTVRQPPPGATMQIPHWTEAIYELDNAILDPNSLAGGSENGQFLYIIQSGDIILELNHIKVSGFTLGEFVQLVESKKFHLLRAVQTKHSHGLSLDIRDYLNRSFPKDSKDKELQNIVRENIYGRTIPCTTRPPKPGEIDKIDYYFLSREQFNELNKRGMLLECGVYAGHFYGTLKPSIDLDQLSECLKSIQEGALNSLRQAWDRNHPAVEMILKKDASNNQVHGDNEHPLYENHESLRMQQEYPNSEVPSQIISHDQTGLPNIIAVDNELLPQGWERVVDQTHGTYYIDHNTQRTQFERPYEVELTKGSMGFGFTLVEADSGLLLVRSIIPGGPAHINGSIRPGDILVSAVGVSVTGIQHTDIARLFSTFAVGDRVRLTFARSNFILDENLVPDEYLFSNGTNGDLAIAVNPDNYQHENIQPSQDPHIEVNHEYESIKVILKRGDQGFGFTISDSIAGQKVREIQNHEICANLKRGDILINLNGKDITGVAHKDVVERLKGCPPGTDVTLTVKRKRRFRSKTPMAMHTNVSGDYSLDSTPRRNCKTPNLDGIMLKRPNNYNSMDASHASRTLFPVSDSARFLHETHSVNTTNYDASPLNGLTPPQAIFPETQLYGSLPTKQQSIYGTNNPSDISQNYNIHEQHSLPNFSTSRLGNPTSESHPHDMRPNLSHLSVGPYEGDIAKQRYIPDVNLRTQSRHEKTDDYHQLNQYNNFMNNDKLMMMQMQQHVYQPQIYSSSDYHQVPLYSNSEVMNSEPELQNAELNPALPVKPINPYMHAIPPQDGNFQNNFYANNEEIALQSMQYGYLPQASQVPATTDQFTFMRPMSHGTPQDEHDEYEYHKVELERESTDSNWGIRLIGGAEVDRAISIGSMIFGGVASKSGKLKSGDEIISIDSVSVVGAAHQSVVELISACTNRVSLQVRRKTFAEACDVVLTRNMDEGFGFVIISNENCALIGKIIEGSPADRCKQLRVRDRIIVVNGRYITSDMKHPEIVNMIKECGSTLRLRIIPVDCYTVKLIKDVNNDSFGFRMRGGSEYDDTPLYIVRVEPNGQAHGLLNVGDQILEINNTPTVGMTHAQAATIIKYSDPIVKLKLRRNYVTPPSLLVDSPRSLQHYNQTAEMKQVNDIPTPNNLIGPHDGTFASLPHDVNFIGQTIQQHPMQVPMAATSSDHTLQPAHHQLIHDQHSMVYGSMYTT